MITDSEEYTYTGLMSVYARENPTLFENALTSILNQTIRPDYFLLVKDGMLTDELENTIKMAKDKFEHRGIRFIQLQNKQNLGLGASLNRGLMACPTEFVARFDSDDVNIDLRMEKTMNAFRENPRLVIVGSQIFEFNTDESHPLDVKNVPTSNDDIKRCSVKRNPFNHMSVTFRKSVISKVGGYIDVPLFEDYFLWIRVIHSKYPVLNLDDILVKAHVDGCFTSKRGGFHYLLKEINFQNLLLKGHYIGIFQYVYNVVVRGSIRILPSKVLRLIYLHLRNTSK